MPGLLDRQIFNMLMQINANLLKLTKILEAMNKDGIKVTTQESHL